MLSNALSVATGRQYVDTGRAERLIAQLPEPEQTWCMCGLSTSSIYSSTDTESYADHRPWHRASKVGTRSEEIELSPHFLASARDVLSQRSRMGYVRSSSVAYGRLVYMMQRLPNGSARCPCFDQLLVSARFLPAYKRLNMHLIPVPFGYMKTRVPGARRAKKTHAPSIGDVARRPGPMDRTRIRGASCTFWSPEFHSLRSRGGRHKDAKPVSLRSSIVLSEPWSKFLVSIPCFLALSHLQDPNLSLSNMSGPAQFHAMILGFVTSERGISLNMPGKLLFTMRKKPRWSCCRHLVITVLMVDFHTMA